VADPAKVLQGLVSALLFHLALNNPKISRRRGGLTLTPQNTTVSTMVTFFIIVLHSVCTHNKPIHNIHCTI